MSDEALRAAEREARARPDDRAAREAYLRALERAVQGRESRRALWTELCGVARVGDASADDRLERWSASGSPEPPATAIDLSRARAILIPRNSRARTTPVALTRTHVLCVSGESIVAHDLLERREAWTHPAKECLPAMAGDDLVHLSAAGLVVREGSTGLQKHVDPGVWGSCLRVIRGVAVIVRDRARRPSRSVRMELVHPRGSLLGLARDRDRDRNRDPSSSSLIRAKRRDKTDHDHDHDHEHADWQLRCYARRIPRDFACGVLGGPQHEAATCLDLLAAKGRALWTTPLQRDTVSIVATRHGLVREVSSESSGGEVVRPSWDLELVDLASGAFSNLRTTGPDDPPIHTQDLVSPDGSSLLFRASQGDHGATHVGELEIPSGEVRWHFDAPWPSRDLWAGAGLALVRRRESGPGALVAIDRTTGRPRWEARLGSVDALAVVGDQVLVAGVSDAGVLDLTSLSTSDGRSVSGRRMALGTTLTHRDGRARVVVADDGVRLAVAGRESLAVVELPALVAAP